VCKKVEEDGKRGEFHGSKKRERGNQGRSVPGTDTKNKKGTRSGEECFRIVGSNNEKQYSFTTKKTDSSESNRNFNQSHPRGKGGRHNAWWEKEKFKKTQVSANHFG